MLTETATGTATRTDTETPTETESDTPRRRDERCEDVWNPIHRWRYATGLRSDWPTVVDGVVYFGAQESSLYALDATEGTVRWQRDQRVQVYTRPVVRDGTVVVASYDEVAAYAAASGDHRWSVAPPGEVGSVTTNVATAGERVFYAADNRPGTMEGTSVPRYHDLHAVDLHDGEQAWTVELPIDTDSEGVAAADGTVYVTPGDGRLLAFDAASGERIWERSVVGAASGYRPVVGQDTVYVQADGHLTAVDAADGRVRWRQDGRFHDEPVVGGDAVYSATRRTLVALDPATGRRRWRAATPTWYGKALGATDDTTFVAVEYDDRVEVLGLDAEVGCRLGSYEVSANDVTRIDTSGDTLFFGGIGGEGELYAVTRPTRRET